MSTVSLKTTEIFFNKHHEQGVRFIEGQGELDGSAIVFQAFKQSHTEI